MKFECKRCGACCRPGWLDGAGGVVNFSPDEQKRAAKHLGLTLPVLRAKYINGNDTVDLTRAACTFLDPEKNHCVIDEIKPDLCQQWPWLDNLTIERQRTWAKRCPGIVIEED